MVNASGGRDQISPASDDAVMAWGDVRLLAGAHAARLLEIDGVVGVMLGGSHARGAADQHSDVDLGVYYRGRLDVEAMGESASDLVGRPTDVAGPGGWGPWVDGGAWLDLAPGRVDWILRDLGRVEAEWERARRGEFSLHHQPGHPFGFVSTTYVGEVALGCVVGDPTGDLGRLRTAAATYPDPLRASFDGWLWEAGFSLDIARKSAGRGDATYVSMCVSHAVGIMAHALHARAGSWVVNEKGLVPGAGALPQAPADFTDRAHAACAGRGARPEELRATLDDAEELLAIVRSGH
jgi:predicted nucleotidyltransferase